jgi:hypothetical protein
MANPQQPGPTDAGTTGIAPIPPLDPDEIRQIQLLQEAVLVSFSANPAALTPFGHATVAWEVTLPTTVIPGVHVEVHLFAGADQVVDATGSVVVGPYTDSSYAISVSTPKAHRQLGTLDLPVDLGSCTSEDTAAIFFTAIITTEANKAFPAGGQVTLRGNGSSVDIGYNSFVVDIPLTASVPNWFDPDVDVSMGFSIVSDHGDVRVTHDLATTNVSFGTASSILSGGCSAAVAAALEAQSNGFLSGFVGPVVAGRIADALIADVTAHLNRLNHATPPPPVPYRFYDLTLTVDGLTYRFCPAHPPTPGHPHPTFGGGFDPTNA